MASSSSSSSSPPSQPHHGIRDNTTLPFPDSPSRFVQSLTANIFSRFPFPAFSPNLHSNGGTEVGPTLFPSRASSSPFADSEHGRSHSPAPSSAFRGLSTSVLVDGFSSSFPGKSGGGPAFVGQVFSMCDPSGTGLMAVTTRWDIPFLTKRTPEWIKKMFAKVTNNEKNSPVFRFFMDLGDAVAYVKQLNIPTGMVGACRLDVAYEHFKEKPHMFQFVPNEKQVKEANKLLKTIPRRSGKTKVDGVPVFTAQNLNIAIATNDGIKWYTPYFFDKSLLDNILEASIDQHFHTLIHNRHMQRRRDAIDDSFTADVVEENDVSLFEPPEVQEVLNEIGHPRIPFSVISKVAEIQMLDVVDKVLLGKRWLRKATGIQPKFPYLVDSFEERSAASVLKAAGSSNSTSTSEVAENRQPADSPEITLPEHTQVSESHQTGLGDSQFPFGDWFSNPLLRLQRKERSDIPVESRLSGLDEGRIDRVPPNPLLPKITMVGVSTGEAGKFSKASLKKTMEDLTRELEQTDPGVTKLNEEKDPLFVANVGDYSSITRMGSS